MDEDSVYTDAEVAVMAEKLAASITETEDYMKPCMYRSDEWSKGPIAWFNRYSRWHNPKGKYPVSIELLTSKQKTIVAEIVGNAMAGGKKANRK